LLVPLLSFACATTQLGKQAADTLIPPEQEVALGQQVKAQVLQQTPVVKDQAVQDYVNGIGQQVVALDQAKLPKGIVPHFTVLDDDQVNAFAIPGGDIFVFSGLLRAVKNDAELASVLSHEMGHVIQRHVAQGMVAQLGLATVAELVLGKNPSKVESLVANVASQGYLMRYTQGNEREADHVGMDTMLRSHWDPQQMIAFFQQLSEGSGSTPGFLAFFSSHPPPADRAQYLGQQLEKSGHQGGSAETSALAGIQSRLPPPRKTAAQPGTPTG
jgi:predicted Zn-dependent protease